MNQTQHFAAVLAILGSISVFAQPQLDLSPDQWREDLAFFKEYVAKEHPNPFAINGRATWEAAIEKLDSDLEFLDGVSAALRFQELMALLVDGHSGIKWDSVADEMHAAPIVFDRFSDGLFVKHAPGNENLVRARVTKIGGVDIDEVEARTRRFMDADNEPHYDLWLPWFAAQHEALVLAGAAEREKPIEYTLDMPSGETKTVEIPTKTLNERDKVFEEDPAVPQPEGNLPLYLQREGENYWFTPLEESGGLYAKFSAVRPMRGNSWVLWTKKLLKEAEDIDAAFIVVDVRLNGGGDGSTLRPLIERLSESEFNTPGRLYVITSGKTFSAATMFVVRMQRACEGVRFAGIPSGGRPNHYGDADPFTLPNSKIEFSLSRLYHEESDPDDTRPCQEVHIPVEISSEDYWNGRDPVLEAVIADHKKLTTSGGFD